MPSMNLYHQYETLTYPASHNNGSVTWSGPNDITLSDVTVNGALASLVLQGTTTLNEAGLHVETCPLINNGDVTLNRSNLDVYALGGTGTIHDNNRSNVTINHAAGFKSSETIDLDGTSSLTIIGAPKMSFLKDVNMAGPGSAVVLEGLGKITAEVYSHGVLELFGPAYHGLAASLHVTAPKGTEVWATQQPNGYVTLTDSITPPTGHIPFFT
jgi:hypothetical protein